MISVNTTLVLGAGASCTMGYPTGWELRKDLLRLATPERQAFAIEAGLFVHGAGPLNEFVNCFRQSQMYSVDAFLARRPEFTDVGKRAIAAVLLSCESLTRLDQWEYDDGWYQYLWNQFGVCAWEELDFKRLRFVTFNYDRSLEHYLLQAIQHSYGKSVDEAIEKLHDLQIVHVYGSLGGALPGSPNYLPWGCGHALAGIAAQSLQVIPEGRDDDTVLVPAREHLKWADRIGFLGFGFDATNMRRLDTESTCCRRMPRLSGESMRPIHATCRGLKEIEAQRAKAAMGDHRSLEPRFYDLNCLDMLRETGLLS